MTRYKWKHSAETSGMDAQDVGEILQEISEQQDGLRPTAVVAVATNPEHPLHPYFEWDDSEAAGKYRIEQARRLIRSVEVEFYEDREVSGEVRAFVTVSLPDDQKYVSTADAMSDEGMRDQILARHRTELQRWYSRYESIEQFSTLVRAVGAALTE